MFTGTKAVSCVLLKSRIVSAYNLLRMLGHSEKGEFSMVRAQGDEAVWGAQLWSSVLMVVHVNWQSPETVGLRPAWLT